MDEGKEKWSIDKWMAYALALKAAHDNALDGWGETVRELERHAALVTELRERNELLVKHVGLVNDLITMLPAKAHAKRRRGRPKKHDGMNWANWYERQCLPKFQEQNPGASCGMQRVLTWYFQQVLKEQGGNPYRAKTKEFAGKVKTLMNLISDQRHPSPRRKAS